MSDRVIRHGGDHAGRWRGVGGGVRGERVHQRVDKLRGAGAQDQGLVVHDGVADGPVQPPDVVLELDGLVEAVGGGVAQTMPSGH